MLRCFILHPFFLSAAAVLGLHWQNADESSLGAVALPLLSIVAIVFGGLLISRLFVRDRFKAGLLLSLLASMVLGYGRVLFLLSGSFNPPRGLIFLGLWILFFILMGYILLARTRNAANLNAALNLAFGVVLIITVGGIALHELRTDTSPLVVPWKLEKPLAERAVLKTPKRDVYYLVFDRYARADMLQQEFDFDNNIFLASLEQLGFYVGSKSYANYPRTAHSLASSLNLNYLDFLTHQYGPRSGNWNPLSELIEKNEVLRFFQDLDYRTIHLGSWWEPTRSNRLADHNVNVGRLGEFSNALIKTSILYPLGIATGLYDERHLQWQRIHHQFDQLRVVASDPKPTFTFGHFLVPHPPFVFDRDGNFIPQKSSAARSKRDAYVEQLIFVNAMILKLVEGLRSQSIQPIIILQADEGPFPEHYLNREEAFDGHTAPTSELRLKMGILNAYSFPDFEYSLLRPSITPVNSFRIVLNHYFGTKLGPLPDRCFAFPGRFSLYDFVDVTDRLQ